MMLITNEKIALVLEEIADALEEQADNPYRIRAFKRAANSIRRYPKNITELLNEGADLTVIPHIGIKISEIIHKMIVTNDFHYKIKIKPAETLPNKLRKKERKNTYKIYVLTPIIEKILFRLRNMPDIIKVDCAGEYRRKKETVGDFDILIVTKNIAKVFKDFHTFPAVKYIVDTQSTYTKVQLKIGIQITLRAVDENEFGAELLHSTGSVEHIQRLKELAYQKKLLLQEKGLYKQSKHIDLQNETAIYQKLALQFIAPELRENRGEIEAATLNQLPNLIKVEDIKGDLHCHTNETDGTFTLEEMVNAAINKGYQYVAITDHSKSLRITNGMDEKRLLKQIEQINLLNERFPNFTILKSMEIDILEDGSLDLEEYVLKELDLTVCSIHSKFRISIQKQTERIIRAMDNPYFNILGHATGRLIKYRQPYKVDMDKVLLAAKERNCFIEVNAQPARLDINDLYCKQAKEIGVKIAISSDAHTINGFNFMILGVNQARRGWLEAKDVINTYSLVNLRKILKR